jgi:dienelactone hydrolase
MNKMYITKGSRRTKVPSAWKAKRHLSAVLVVVSLSAAACSSAADNAGSSTTNPASTIATQAATTNPGTVGTEASTTSSPASTQEVATTPIPAPDGPFAVGVTNLPMPDASVYYPAQNDTGNALHRYFDPELLSAVGLPAGELADQLLSLTTSSRVDAAPLVGNTPRQVVVLQPGLASTIALSTALAEHLASHGYVVVALQTDMATEATVNGLDVLPSVIISTVDPARNAQLKTSFDLIESPEFENLVGPVDPNRIAVGGHSYAGSIAYNFSLQEPRVAAVFNLDGGIYGQAETTATKVPSLFFTHVGDIGLLGEAYEDTARANPNFVGVRLLNAWHYDFTDAPSIGDILESMGQTLEVGTIGPVATSNTSVIVQRFLDAALSNPARLPSASELVDGLPSTSVNVFAE